MVCAKECASFLGHVRISRWTFQIVKAFIGDVSSDALVQVEERKEEEIRIPPGLSFEHDSYHVRFGKTKKLVLRAKIVGEDLEGVTVNWLLRNCIALLSGKMRCFQPIEVSSKSLLPVVRPGARTKHPVAGLLSPSIALTRSHSPTG